MTTITTEAIQYAYDTVLERLDIAGEMDSAGKEVAYLFTAARFAVEASQRINALQVELVAWRAMTQRLATEGNQGGLTAAELKALASAAEVVAIQLCDPRDHTGGLLKIVDKAKAIAVRMEARDDSG